MSDTITNTCELVAVEKREYEALKELRERWAKWKAAESCEDIEEAQEELMEWNNGV